jgi:8-oxo-dGTP pyrophosphatase MutT (NUDIX family)
MTVTRDEIHTTLDRYLDRFPGEAEALQPLRRALDTGADITARTEFANGHVTCGAVVLDDTDRLLLIQHRMLGRWLLPGGHLEAHDAGLLQAALRELAEETGIPRHGALPVHDDNQQATPIDIDIHPIPANPDKGEPAHWHADFRYAFRVRASQVRLQAEEVDGYAWRPPTEAPTARLAAKLGRAFGGV